MKKFFIFVEIPEFEGFFLNERVKVIRLYGVESEKPLLRLNNFLFEGKWVFFLYKPLLFSKQIEKNKKRKIRRKIILNFVEKNEKFTSKVFFKKYLKSDKNIFSIEKKILRFYRIPLLINMIY
jgi:hypothetical protein